jgi:membrane protein involved in D-alanine export
MIPYSNFLFFYIAALMLFPAIILGLLGKKIKYYGFAANLFMLVLIYKGVGLQFRFIVAYYIIQLVLVKLYVKLRRNNSSRYILWCFVLLSILPLIISKISGEFIHRQLGFLGISYLTFKAVQMLLEIFDGLIKEVKILEFTYFLLFFPTVSSGPIDRSRRFQKDLDKNLTSKEYGEYLGNGLEKLLMGILYKFIIAYSIHTYWLSGIPKIHHTVFDTLNYMYAYSFYLFFDFAGYSLIAVGVSYILGIRTPDNFKLPFISKDMKEFWNRWHISLSFWFRDFIYTRFVMNSIKKKWFKSKYTASYIGYLITMGLMGVWHGTEKHYIVYGLYQAAAIILTDIYQRKGLYKKVKDKNLYKIASTIVTFNLICFGFLIFSGYLFN